MLSFCTNEIENEVCKLYDIHIVNKRIGMEALLYEKVSRLRNGHCKSGYQMP